MISAIFFQFQRISHTHIVILFSFLIEILFLTRFICVQDPYKEWKKATETVDLKRVQNTWFCPMINISFSSGFDFFSWDLLVSVLFFLEVR